MRHLLPALLLALAACGSPGHPTAPASSPPAPVATPPAAGGECPAGMRFYQPACDASTFDPGCFTPCTPDTDCGLGAMCVTIAYDPCSGRGADGSFDPDGPNATCEACGAETMVCQAVSTID